MCLETLKDVTLINNFEVVRGKPDNMSWNEFDEARKCLPILITEEKNMISFRLQKGPIKENGVNGCQVDTLIEAAKLIIEGLNKNFPCRENSCAITKLDEALMWLNKRKMDRELRKVEGLNKL